MENDDVEMALLMMGWWGGCVGTGHGGSGEWGGRALDLQTRAELHSPLSALLVARCYTKGILRQLSNKSNSKGDHYPWTRCH